MNNGTYAGIGSRRTTFPIALMLYRLGCAFSLKGVKCLTGGAPGSDDAFEKGARAGYELLSTHLSNPGSLQDYLTVFLPWNNFNYRSTRDPVNWSNILPKAEVIAAKHHPGWSYLKDRSPVKPLMARNSHQVLDKDLATPVRFVFCYTPDGVTSYHDTTEKTGGTGQAIRLASSMDIPVYNIGNPSHFLRAEKFIESAFNEFSEILGVALFRHTEEKFLGFMPFTNVREVDLVQAALRGEVGGIIHGSNCMTTMGSGIALSIRNNFHEAYLADRRTKKGDRKKLGTFSYADCNRNGNTITVVNAYTQWKYGRDESLKADYDAIRKSCKSIRKAFPDKVFGIPRIGTGLANGSWITIADILVNELGNDKTVLFDFEPDEPKIEKTPEQSALDL